MRTMTRLVLFLGLVAILLWAFPFRSRRASIAAMPFALIPDGEISFRILLGLTDARSTRWDGSLSVTQGTVVGLEPWRFDDDDRMDGASAWRLSTHQTRVFGVAPNRPVVANGVVAMFRNLAPASEVRVETAQGNFQFRPRDLSYGTAIKLRGGRVLVDRVPPSAQVTNPPGDYDYPAAASDREGNLWVNLREIPA